MRRLLQFILLVFITSITIWNCKGDFKESILPSSKIDTITFTHSIKGWELYSWPERYKWKYSLLVGTNAVKNLSQVKTNPICVTGEDSLKILLNKLPKGEEILWIGQQWLKNNWGSNYGNIRLPSRSIQIEVKEFCDCRYLKINILE